MKKSVVLLIFIIYVASIAIIGIFGLKIAFYKENIYVTEIVCINEDLYDDTLNGVPIKKVVIDIDEQNTYWIQWRVFPEDATNKRVSFSTGKTSIATVDNRGIVTFNKRGTVTVYVTALDGSNTKSIIKITAWKFD